MYICGGQDWGINVLPTDRLLNFMRKYTKNTGLFPLMSTVQKAVHPDQAFSRAL